MGSAAQLWRRRHGRGYDGGRIALEAVHGRGGSVMDDGPLAWLPDSPFRSPSWRWRRASYLRECGGRTDPRIDDAWVLRACRYLEADGADGGRTRTRPGRRDAPVRAALDLARAEPPHPRWRLEAYLLTDVPLEDVARRC